MFSLESPIDVNDRSVRSIKDYIVFFSDPIIRDEWLLDFNWQIETSKGVCRFGTYSASDIPHHVLLQTVETFKDDHGDRYKLKTETSIGPGITRYIFAIDCKYHN